MHCLEYNARRFGVLIRQRWPYMAQKSLNFLNLHGKSSSLNAGSEGFSSAVTGERAAEARTFDPFRKVLGNIHCSGKTLADSKWTFKDASGNNGIPVAFRGQSHYTLGLQHARYFMLPCFVRTLTSNSASRSSDQTSNEEGRKEISTVEDPFDAPTYNIPEKPVTFAEGASYSLVILAGLGIAGALAYAVCKELIFQPKEYKIFGKALERVQNDSQVKVRIGSPVTGYGQESRNRAARQRIPNRTWTDEDGVERVEVNFHIRGPRGAGKVYTEMFKDKVDKQWKYTYLIVEIGSPSPAQLMLESYVPA